MPRQVDHAERRRRIAEAVCLLADEHGIEGVTLRDAAARAGVSMGAVQRCFRTKEEMLVFALRHVSEQITDRARARTLRSPAQSAGTALGLVAAEVALLREEHRAEARIWLAFVAQAVVSAPLAAVLRGDYAELHQMVTRLVSEARGTGQGAQLAARTLLALTDGLTTQVLVGHLTAHQAQEVLHAHLAGLQEQPGR